MPAKLAKKIAATAKAGGQRTPPAPQLIEVAQVPNLPAPPSRRGPLVCWSTALAEGGIE
jgi:hypothetical protein